MNYFAHQTAARRYARSRPFFHPLVVARIKSFLKLRAPLRCALDVACGAGQSTVALREIAERVVGADVSKEMLREAVLAYEAHESTPAHQTAGTREAHETAGINKTHGTAGMREAHEAGGAHEAHETAGTNETHAAAGTHETHVAAGACAFVAATAERLPFAGGSFDLIAVSMAFHWLDRALFLPEARRLLRCDAWLVVYNNLFFGTMLENPAFAHWHRDAYLARFPAPPRHSQPLTADEASAYGLRLAGHETYANDVSFTALELAGYLTTQSNVIAAVEHGREDLDKLHAWLVSSLAPLFPAPRCTFHFGGDIRYLQKQ